MEEIVNQLLTVGEGLLLLGTTWFLWFISGVANNLFSTNKWSWKRTGEDLLKTFLMVVATLGWVVVINLLDHYTANLGFDISKLLDGASVVGLLGIIVGGASVYTYKAYRNIIKFFIKDHTVLEEIETELGMPGSISASQYAQSAEIAKQVIGDVYQFFNTPKESVETHEQWEKGGRGSFTSYNVSIASYDAFRNTVMGRGYNLDGAYGAQCWDGACLVYQQVGMWLQTGNGCAYGCWTLKKDANLGNKFIAISNVNDVKRGDIVVFRAGTYGHIGYADADYRGEGYIKVLGQNQNGAPYPDGGSCFNVVNFSTATFLGAFRLKQWIVTAEPATEKPAEKPAEKPIVTTPVTIEKGDRVRVTNFVDVNGVALRRDLQPDFLVYQSRKSDRTAVLKSNNGDIYARLSWDSLQKV